MSEATRVPQVVIVGRPNVGKSTLFNRVVGRREAIVGGVPGMTRDRHTAEADWAGVRFVLTDTGGLEWGTADDLLQEVEKQVLVAVETADVVVLVVDGRDGPIPVEADIAGEIRRRGIRLLLAVNKCDTRDLAERLVPEFYGLGVADVHGISAEQGPGVGDLLDAVVAALAELGVAQRGVAAEPEVGASVALVGRPNVGKSSLVNALLGAPRVIVSEQPGTTRDAIDTLLERDGRRYLIVDTAGIRKPSKIDTHVEIASIAAAQRRIERADVALLVIDPHEGVTRQDLRVASAASDRGCGLVIVVNKWDTVPQGPDMQQRFVRYVGNRLGRMRFAPVAFTSAVEGSGVAELLPLIDRVVEARGRRVPTARLNAAFEEAVQRHGVTGGTAGTPPKYLTQVGVDPPTFVAFAGGRGAWRADYRRYLENRLRQSFDFTGTPLVIKLRRGRAGRGSAAVR